MSVMNDMCSEVDSLKAQVAELKQQRDELQRDAERGRYMLKHASWYRCDIDQITQLVVGVRYGSDLSCYAMREAAIDAAIAKAKEQI